MKKKIAVLIDGGHLRVYTRKARKNFVPDYIEKVAHSCSLADEEIHRVLFYDCPPYNGSAIQPVSGYRELSPVLTHGSTNSPGKICLPFVSAY